MRVWICTLALCLKLSLDVLATTPPDSLTLLITGSLRGRINGCNCPSANKGGLARRAALMSQLFGDTVPLGVDCGQLLDLDPQGGRVRSLCAIQSLSKLGTQVSLVTTRDLFYGVDFIKQAADLAHMSLVCANLVDDLSDKPIFPTWVEIEHNGVKLAFTGLTRHSPHRRIPGMGSWRTIPADSALVQVKATIPTNADLIILLTDLSEAELNELIPAFPKIDIAFTSSSRVTTSSPFTVNSTLVVKPRRDGNYLEGLVVPYKKSAVNARFLFHPINSQTPLDEEFETWLKSCQNAGFANNQ